MAKPHPPWDAPAVEQAVAHVSAQRPAYASMLAFYGPVFMAQIRSADETSPAEIDVDESILKMKAEEGFSLIEPTAFTVDLTAAESLLKEICRIAAASGEQLGGAGEALLRALDDGLAVADYFSDVLDAGGRLRALADRLAVRAEMLSLLFYLAATPSLKKGARRLADRLTEKREGRGSCPVCGSAPIIGELDPEGKQWLHCGLCWQRWPVERLTCPFCRNRDGATLEYVYSEDEPEYRVNLCARCRRYVKVADVRKMKRRFFPPLEQVASLHLDMLVAEKGYHHAVANAGGPFAGPTTSG